MTLMASLSQSNDSFLIITEPISALAYVMIYFMFLTLIADVICSLLPLDILPFLPHFRLFVSSRLHSWTFSHISCVCKTHGLVGVKDGVHNSHFKAEYCQCQCELDQHSPLVLAAVI